MSFMRTHSVVMFDYLHHASSQYQSYIELTRSATYMSLGDLPGLGKKYAKGRDTKTGKAMRGSKNGV